MDGDGIDEIVTGAGPGSSFGTHVRGWNYDGGELTSLSGFNMFVWDPSSVHYGARVCVVADLDGDGRDDLVAAPGPDPNVGSLIKVYRYDDSNCVAWFSLTAFSSEWPGGARVAACRF